MKLLTERQRIKRNLQLLSRVAPANSKLNALDPETCTGQEVMDAAGERVTWKPPVYICSSCHNSTARIMDMSEDNDCLICYECITNAMGLFHQPED